MSERWLRVLAWAIVGAAIAIFGVTTWPALPIVLAVGIGILAVLWAILFLVTESKS
jgi:hypothetical protein